MAANARAKLSDPRASSAWSWSPNECAATFASQHDCLIGRIPEDGHLGNQGRDLLEQFQLFSDYLGGQVGQACDVSTRPREAGDEPTPHRIASIRHDNGDRPSSLLGCKGRVRSWRYDHGNVETDEVGREVRESLILSFRGSVLERYVLALHVAEFSEPLGECPPETRTLRVGERDIPQNTYPIHLPRQLCLGSERRGEETEGSSDECSPVHYSISSSARASTEGGMVRRNALAVLRL